MSLYFEIIGRIATYSVAAYGAGYTLAGISAAHRRPTIEAIEEHKEMVISEFADIKATLDDEPMPFDSKHRIRDAVNASENKIRGGLIDLKFGKSK